jgi:uncharacterized UPF0146 family protein
LGKPAPSNAKLQSDSARVVEVRIGNISGVADPMKNLGLSHVDDIEKVHPSFLSD